MSIIAFCGFIGSGKDTAADYLVNFHQFRRESFASTLKDAVAAVFGWDRVLLEGKTKQAREWREQVDQWWADRLGIPNLTPRWVLQFWGTDVLRKNFHDDIWIASLENKLRIIKDDIVISDCRFPNEISALQRQGAQIVWVQRGDLPEWYSTAQLANDSNDPKIMIDKYPTVHPSEWAWAGTKFDMVIDNNRSIEDLYNNIKSLV